MTVRKARILTPVALPNGSIKRVWSKLSNATNARGRTVVEVHKFHQNPVAAGAVRMDIKTNTKTLRRIGFLRIIGTPLHRSHLTLTNADEKPVNRAIFRKFLAPIETCIDFARCTLTLCNAITNERKTFTHDYSHQSLRFARW